MITVQRVLPMDKRDVIFGGQRSENRGSSFNGPNRRDGDNDRQQFQERGNQRRDFGRNDRPTTRNTNTGTVHNAKHLTHAGRVVLTNNVIPREINSVSLTVARMMGVSVSRVTMSILKSVIRPPARPANRAV